jgi:hypothetical protein
VRFWKRLRRRLAAWDKRLILKSILQRKDIYLEKN